MGIFFFRRGERLLSLLLPWIIFVSFVIDSKLGLLNLKLSREIKSSEKVSA